MPRGPAFRLRFDERDIPKWAARYSCAGSDADLLDRIRPLVLVRGHLTRAALATSDEALWQYSKERQGR